VILLLPVPVFAVTWASTGSNNVWTLDSSVLNNPTNVSSILGTGYGPLTSPSQPDFLFIQPTVTSNTPTSITLLRDFFPASPNSSGLTATALLNNFSLQSGTSLSIAVWVTQAGTSTDVGDILGTNAGANPVTITGGGTVPNQFGTPTPGLSGRNTVHVQFSISSGNWSTSSTPKAVVQFFDN
jgi:hypothetical protein